MNKKDNCINTLLENLSLSPVEKYRILFNTSVYRKVYWLAVNSIKEQDMFFYVSIGLAKNIQNNLIWVIKEENRTSIKKTSSREIICFESYEQISSYLKEQEYYSELFKKTLDNVTKKLCNIL